MRLNLLLTLAVLFLFACKKNKDLSQEPIPNNKALAWIKTFGGSNYDFANSIVQLSTGQYIVAGTTRSTDGDISGSRIGYDAWLAKVDNAGNKIWSTTFGANDDDYATSVMSTTDGGYLITGYSNNVSQNIAWAIKTDGAGNKVWQKNISPSTDAKANAVVSNGDGTFLIAGYTSTGGNRDGWITKIDASGSNVWTKTYGGSTEDWFTSLVKTSDGNYTLSGYTNSRDGEMSSNRGNYDGWAMKIDGSGNKIWSVNFGGSNEDYFKSLVQSPDGGFLLAGYSKSTDVDIPLNKGGYDEWLVKIDGSGNKQWVKTYGGANEEYITTVVNTSDGGFLTIGYSNSTTGDVTRPNNNFSGWLVKMDGSGSKVASSTYGHTSQFDDFTNTLITTQDGGYLVGGYTYVEGRGYDAWLVKIDRF